MLRRRFAKLPLDEAGSNKAREFVFEGLIDYIGTNKYIQTYGCTENINPIERLFSMIENELRYVHEFLHTRVPRNYYFRRVLFMDRTCVLTMLATGIYLSVTVCKSDSSSFSHVAQDAYSDCNSHLIRQGSNVMEIFTRLDKGITIFLVVACIYVQASGWAHDRWGILDYVKEYFENPVKWNNSHKVINSEVPNRENNVNETGVDSLVHYVGNNWSFFGRIFHEPCCAAAINWMVTNSPVRITFAFQSTHAKETVLKSLRDSGGRLTNGETSLKKHGMENMSWACPPNESLTEAILVWHIATTLFYHQKPPPAQNNHPRHESQSQQNSTSSLGVSFVHFFGQHIGKIFFSHKRIQYPFNKEREVASALSNYCHYLLKYLPELLQEEVEWIEEKYENLRADMLEVDQGKSVKIRCNYAWQATWDETTVLGKGVNLAKDLAGHANNGAPVWTMLADFWAELILFISASDNVEAHEEILEQREFITQLWALLTHAGILSRPKITLNLPSPWNEGTDAATGKIYFWNPETGVIQVERPIATSTPAPAVEFSTAPLIGADAAAPTPILISREAFSLRHEITDHSVDHQSESDDITGDMNV